MIHYSQQNINFFFHSQQSRYPRILREVTKMNIKIKQKVIDMEEEMLYLDLLSIQDNPPKTNLVNRINNLEKILQELRKEVVKL